MADKNEETKDVPKPSSSKASPEHVRGDGTVKIAVSVEEEDEQKKGTVWGAAVAGFSSWFTSTISSAKEKTLRLFQYLKQDSNSETVSEASNIILKHVKDKIYSHAMKTNTYTQDPYNKEEYKKWLLTFDLEKKSNEITELMSANPYLEYRYNQLVPDRVSHLVFWHRFYFRVHEICVDEEKIQKEMLELRMFPRNKLVLNALHQLDQSLQVAAPDSNEERIKNGSAQHFSRSSGTHLSSSSFGSFAMVTNDVTLDEVKVE